MKRGAKTAAELLAELAADPGFQSRQAQMARDRERMLERDRSELQAVVQRLKRRGCMIESLAEATPATAPPAHSLPVLTDAISRFSEQDTSVIAAIAAAVVRVAPGAQGAGALLAEFARRRGPADDRVRWTIGNVLEEVVGHEHEDQLVALVTDAAYGTSRNALLPALRRLGSARLLEALAAAARDPQLAEVAHGLITRGR